MKKIKIAEAIGPALDWLVGEVEVPAVLVQEGRNHGDN